jgi:hypothetical protein
VESLLLAPDKVDGILECAPGDLALTSAAPLADAAIGATVGPYRLLEQVGGGGMAVVDIVTVKQELHRLPTGKGSDTVFAVPPLSQVRSAVTS